MNDQSDITKLYECPVCGFEAESESELSEHFEIKSDDQHKEYSLDPDDKEVLNEDSVGAPAGTPGHPGLDEGTDE